MKTPAARSPAGVFLVLSRIIPYTLPDPLTLTFDA